MVGARTRVREIPVCLSGETKEIKKKKKKRSRKYVKDKKDVRGVAKTEEEE